MAWVSAEKDFLYCDCRFLDADQVTERLSLMQSQAELRRRVLEETPCEY